MSDIIQMYPIGRFGNQMFEYAFLKKYAELEGLELQVPRCSLHSVFEIPEPEPTASLPLVKANFKYGQYNVMVKDYFQKKEFTDYYTKEYCRNIFKYKAETLNRTTGKFYLIGHLRVGDFVRRKHLFTIVSWDSYKKAMTQYGYQPDAAFWVSEQRGSLSFIDDFMTLAKADILFRANSSYSLWAHVLSINPDQKCYSPILKDAGEQNCEFAEGGDQPILVGQDSFLFAK